MSFQFGFKSKIDGMYFDAMATERDVKQKTNNFSTNHKDTELNNEQKRF